MDEQVHLLSHLWDCLSAFWTDVTYSNVMDYYATNPGPVDDSILYDQDKHVSAAVWEGQVFSLYNFSLPVLFYKAFVICNMFKFDINRREVHLDAMNILQSLIVGCLPRNRLNW